MKLKYVQNKVIATEHHTYVDQTVFSWPFKENGQNYFIKKLKHVSNLKQSNFHIPPFVKLKMSTVLDSKDDGKYFYPVRRMR